MGVEGPPTEGLDAHPPWVVDSARQPEDEIQRALANNDAGEADTDYEDDARLLGVDGDRAEPPR